MATTPFKAYADTISSLSLLLSGVIATVVLLSLPLLVAGMSAQFGWGDKEIGWLASADMAGSAMASVCLLPFMSRLNWRATAFKAITIAISGNILSIYADSLPALLATRFFTGTGNGIILSIVFVGLCHSKNPDRFFAGYTFTQLSLQALLLATLPALIKIYGMSIVYILLASLSATSILLINLFPKNSLQNLNTSQSAHHDRKILLGSSLHSWASMALVAQALYFLAPAAMWGYFESIGQSFSLDMSSVGKALGLSSFAGIAGALTVIIMGARFNRLHCMTVGTCISILAILLLAGGSGFLYYFLAASLFNYAWNFTFPYQMGMLALFDESGSVAILSLIVQLLGLACGPVLASLLLFGESYIFIFLACIICYIASLSLFYHSYQKFSRFQALPNKSGATG